MWIMAVRLSRPAYLIDIKAVGGLDVLAVRDETMRRLFASAVAMLSAFGWWSLGFIIGTVLLVPSVWLLRAMTPWTGCRWRRNGAVVSRRCALPALQCRGSNQGAGEGRASLEGCNWLRAALRSRLGVYGVDGNLADLSRMVHLATGQEAVLGTTPASAHPARRPSGW